MQRGNFSIKIVVAATAALFFFALASHAQAATLYYNNATSDGNWNTLGNWWTDAGFTSPAGSLPGSSDDAIIAATVATNTGPAASVNTLTVGTGESSAYTFEISITATNGAVFNGDSVAISDGATQRTITGDVIFNDRTATHDAIMGDATFNDSSSISDGSISGNAIFNDTSGTGGTVTVGGNTTFDGGTFNRLSGTLVGNVSFTYRAQNLGTITGNASFYDSTQNTAGGTVSGDACFAPTAVNAGTVSGSITTCASTAPTVETLRGLPVATSTEGLTGKITNTGSSSATTVGFEYGLTASYGSSIASSSSGFVEGFGIPLRSLTCDTTYHFRAFATNVSGTAYGNDATFTTGSCDYASVLYGIDGSGSNSNPPNLYILNPSTGNIVSTIGPVGENISGLAFDPDTGVLYGTSGGNGTHPKSLFTVSTSTGAATWLGTMKDSGNTAIPMPDIAFRSDGTLFGWSGSGWDLYTIDPTSCNGTSDTNCLGTKVGEFAENNYICCGMGLEFDRADHLLFFGDEDDTYWEINPETGVSISHTSFTNSSDSVYHPIAAVTTDETDVLFLSNMDSDTSSLLIMSTDTSTTVDLGPSNPDMLNMDAIAFYNPPAVSDTTAPTITITGDNPAQVLIHNSYTDAGATATDDTDGDVTSSITSTGSVDTDTIGTYHIVYQVSDAALNTAYATRTVEVISRGSGSGGGSSGSHHLPLTQAIATITTQASTTPGTTTPPADKEALLQQLELKLIGLLQQWLALLQAKH